MLVNSKDVLQAHFEESLAVKQAALDFAAEMVRVAECSIRVVAGFPDERLHAFRTARFRCQLLDEDQGIAANRDGVVKFLLRGRNSVVV